MISNKSRIFKIKSSTSPHFGQGPCAESIHLKVHSLYFEQRVPTPILKSLPSQFSPFVRGITNAWHALQNNSCPKSP